MSQYKLSSDFTKLSESSGVFYVMPGQSIEVSDTAKADTGFVLHGGCAKTYSSSGIVYARALGSQATLNVVAGTLS
jgi:hypothetical protein